MNTYFFVSFLWNLHQLSKIAEDKVNNVLDTLIETIHIKYSMIHSEYWITKTGFSGFSPFWWVNDIKIVRVSFKYIKTYLKHLSIRIYQKFFIRS